jgi:hypothetical protein
MKRILLRVDWHQVRDSVQLGLEKQSQLDHAVMLFQVLFQVACIWF